MKRRSLSLVSAVLMLGWAAAAGAVTPSDALQIVARHTALFDRPPRNVPTAGMPDGPLLGNGDVGVVLAGPAEEQQFFIGKNDFWRQTGQPQILTVGSVVLDIPALAGASYRQEQDMAQAEVRGTFSKGETTLHLRSWVDANENLLVTVVRCEGPTPVEVAMRQQTGATASVPTRVGEGGRVNVGREQFGGGRWYFDGMMDSVRIEPRALSAQEILGLAAKRAASSSARHFDGKSVFAELAAPHVDKAVSVAAWIKIESAAAEANYIVSKGPWNHAYSLGLSNGRLRWAIGGTFVQTDQPLELHKWIHVAGTFDGRRMDAYVDGVSRASLGRGGSGTVDLALATSSLLRAADASPQSRRVAVVTRILDGSPRAGRDGQPTVTVRPGREVVFATAVLSDLDAQEKGDRHHLCEAPSGPFRQMVPVPFFPLAAATRRVAALRAGDVETLAAAHRAWWADFWSRSFVEIPDKQIEKRWYAALYVLGSCSRSGKVAPGLWGNWITTDSANWHGDFHLNYNFQAPFYLVYSANHADLSLPFYRAIWESVPNGRAMAKRHGWKGVHFPVSIGPWGLFPENPDGDWGQRSDAAFAALNFIWQYQYTQDAAFLRKTAYPYLREVADFWENYLKLENGRYVIYNDSIHEGSGPDMNPLLSLGLVRTLFKNLLAMSQDLGVDADRRGKWRDICAKISDFPLQASGGKTVFRYSEKGMAWCGGNTLGIHHIFPAGAIGLESDPKLLAICHNTIDAMHRWADYNGFSSWYTACARVGYDPQVILLKLRAECDKHSFPNLLLYYGGGGIESCGGFLAVNEMLLQSHEGVIRFFPCWPKDQDARFGDLRAVGAFVVSAELKNRIVSGVKIVSEKGRDCALQNPWPEASVRVIRNGKPSETVSGPRVTLKTAPGEILALRRL